MKRALALAILATALVVQPAAPASAAPDKTGKVEVGKPFLWDGTRKVGSNLYYFPQHSAQPSTLGPFSTYTCSAQPYQSCEVVLLEFSNPLTQAEIDAGKTSKTKTASISVTQFDPAQSDFDFVIYESNAEGAKGPFYTGASSTSTSGNLVGEDESLSFTVTTTVAKPSVYVLLEVVYFLAPNATYKGRASL